MRWDREWWMRYLSIYGLDGISKSEEVLANFRLHEQSKSVLQSESFNIERDLIFEGLKKGEEPFDEIDAGLKASVLAYYNLLKADEAYYNKTLQ
jgi:hypothetical protein